jgi:hypothetical protein
MFQLSPTAFDEVLNIIEVDLKPKKLTDQYLSPMLSNFVLELIYLLVVPE